MGLRGEVKVIGDATDGARVEGLSWKGCSACDETAGAGANGETAAAITAERDGGFW